MSGRVGTIAAVAGDTVEKGDLLVRITPSAVNGGGAVRA